MNVAEVQEWTRKFQANEPSITVVVLTRESYAYHNAVGCRSIR
jgi:hypothetical protein